MHILRIAAVAVAIGAAVVLTGIDAAQAKGHDNGVADGSPSGNPSVGGQTAGQGGNAVSAGQRDGQRDEVPHAIKVGHAGEFVKERDHAHPALAGV